MCCSKALSDTRSRASNRFEMLKRASVAGGSGSSEAPGPCGGRIECSRDGTVPVHACIIVIVAGCACCCQCCVEATAANSNNNVVIGQFLQNLCSQCAVITMSRSHGQLRDRSERNANVLLFVLDDPKWNALGTGQSAAQPHASRRVTDGEKGTRLVSARLVLTHRQ